MELSQPCDFSNFFEFISFIVNLKKKIAYLRLQGQAINKTIRSLSCCRKVFPREMYVTIKSKFMLQGKFAIEQYPLSISFDGEVIDYIVYKQYFFSRLAHQLIKCSRMLYQLNILRYF